MHAIRRALLAAAVAASFGLAGPAARGEDAPGETLLLQDPTISADRIVFAYAGDLWSVGRAGGEATRLTSSPGTESNPRLSPDGKWVAFTGQYEGDADVYLMPVEGGTPRRLTWHPGPDFVCGWHPDGKRVLFLTGRDSGVPVLRPALVSVEGGGLPEMTSIPKASHASFRDDGKAIAYTPIKDATRTWKRYRGGMTGPVWVYDPETREVRQAPHVNATDTHPCWVGDTVFFASDRDGLMNIWKWVPGAKEAEQVTRFKDIGVRRMSSGAGVVVFERAGAISVYEPKDGSFTRLRIHCVDDGLSSNPRWAGVGGALRDAFPAPNGKRAVVEARGEIFSVPREKGDVRNLTDSPGANDRSPAWSPEGDRIAWLSDVSGEYRLQVGDSLGRDRPRAYDLGGARFYYRPQWSPDGKAVLFTDKGNRIAFVTLETGKVTDVSSPGGDLAFFDPYGCWSPDSKWIAFEERNTETMYDRVALFEVATGRKAPLTDGFAASFAPAFSRDGKLLFFAASVDSGPARFDLDLSASAARRHQESLYAVVLQKDGKNPFAPKSDEGKDPPEEPTTGADKDKDKEKGKEKEKKPESIPPLDVEGVDQRIVAMPNATGDFWQLRCTKERLLLLDRGGLDPSEEGTGSLKGYDMDGRKLEGLEEGVTGFEVSADGGTVLLGKGGQFLLADGKGKDGKRLDLDAVKVRVDPAKEWPEILRDIWRIQRDYFYDAGMHGVDWNAMWDRWSAFLPHVRHRDDLSLIVGEMMGELCCGHEYLWGGEKDAAPAGAPTGLLGADWEAAGDRYRIRRIYRGQNWNPGLRAPLTEPGVDAREGDYLVSVDGKPVAAAANLYAAFANTAGRTVEIALSAAADGSAPRVSKVVPVDEEARLRRLAWVEDRRRIVDQLSGGKLAYVYMPDTGDLGLAAFERDFYSQLDRRGLVLDERYNGGGKVADHVVSVLSRKVLCWWRSREGWVGRTPFGTLQGPKVMIINESAGSGGDAMPWMFRKAGLGPLVGTRTWGGLVGISGYPPLMDGGSVTSAAFGIIDTDGRWTVENEGVAPDFEVVETPKDAFEGHDVQLEKAVSVAMDLMKGWKYDEKPEYRPPAPR